MALPDAAALDRMKYGGSAMNFMTGKDLSGVEQQSLFVTAPDGLKLHIRAHGPRLAPNPPVVCLPGLTRTTDDFDELATLLAADPQSPRRVFSLDYRGRGQSEYDPDPRNYALGTELADLLAVLTALDVPPAVFVGTSRGGLLTMLLAAARPTAIMGAVFNDIGPVIEPTGLARIKSYVGKLPQPKTFEEGAEILRRVFSQHFTNLSEADWLAFSRRSYRMEQNKLVPTYDPRLAKTLEGIDFHRPLPALWAEFDALARVPLMVLRGANSDLLSEQTVAAMRARRPSMETLVVPDQGHAPILSGADLLEQVRAFVVGISSRN
jgi:pimeloyl-ACP methyl ester carboxylesterase